MWKRHVLRKPEDDTGGGGGSAPATAAPATPAPAAAAPAAAPDKSPAPEAGSQSPAAPDKSANEGYWPADWRETVSKGDAKILARVSRYASPQAAMDALIAAQNRISAGELKPVLGKNASADEVKAWRAEHGIPETPDKYDVGNAPIDKELLNFVLQEAHATNQTPDQVKATINAWNKISTAVADQRAESDQKAQKDGEDALRAEWGGEFRRNINLVHGMLDGVATPGMKDAILGGRLADGTPIGSSPEALKFLVGLALIQNPTGVVVPGADGNQAQGVEDEITKIEKGMRENRAAYNRDEKLQARYRELLGAREALKPRRSA